MPLVSLITHVWDILLIGLLFGAGLPTLFALGMRALAGRTEYRADGTLVQTQRAGALGHFIAYICFGIVFIAIIAGILWITQGFIYHATGIDLFGTVAAAHP